jgi:hypothetical protein
VHNLWIAQGIFAGEGIAYTTAGLVRQSFLHRPSILAINVMHLLTRGEKIRSQMTRTFLNLPYLLVPLVLDTLPSKYSAPLRSRESYVDARTTGTNYCPKCGDDESQQQVKSSIGSGEALRLIFSGYGETLGMQGGESTEVTR